MSLTPVKAIALVVFLAAIAGATYGVQQIVGDSVSASLVSVEALHLTRNVTAGHDVTFPFTLHNRDAEDRDMKLAAVAPFTGETGLIRVPAGSSTATFLTVSVPADAAVGRHALTLRVTDDAGEIVRERQGAVELRVLAPGAGYATGAEASFVFTGRVADTGRLFFSNDVPVAGAPFLRVPNYQGIAQPMSGAQLQVPGLIEGVQGMIQGESRTFTVPFEKGYGPTTIERREPREETLEREAVLPFSATTADRSSFNTYITQSGQGDPATYKEGSTFHVQDQGNPNRLPYRVLNITDREVRYIYDFHVGDKFTIYSAWPQASEVVNTTATSATFRTTPTTPEGSNVTLRSSWGNTTMLVSLTDTSIVVRHSPTVGTSYEEENPQTGARARITVREVSDTEIVLASPSNRPLAGQALVYDVTLVKLG